MKFNMLISPALLHHLFYDLSLIFFLYISKDQIRNKQILIVTKAKR